MTQLPRMLVILAYYLLGVFGLPTLMRRLFRCPFEIVRKIQHVAYSMSMFLLLTLFDRWYLAIMSMAALLALGLPALWLMERHPAYRSLLVDRAGRGGELKFQLIWVQVSFSVLIGIFWGLLGPRYRYIAAVAAAAWGFGDAAAALVGKYFGRHRLKSRFIDMAKTYEGTFAMAAVSWAAMFVTLIWFGRQSVVSSLIISLALAPVASAVEAFSRKGLDTLTIPLAIALVAIPIVLGISWLGW